MNAMLFGEFGDMQDMQELGLIAAAAPDQIEAMITRLLGTEAKDAATDETVAVVTATLAAACTG